MAKDYGQQNEKYYPATSGPWVMQWDNINRVWDITAMDGEDGMIYVAEVPQKENARRIIGLVNGYLMPRPCFFWISDISDALRMPGGLVVRHVVVETPVGTVAVGVESRPRHNKAVFVYPHDPTERVSWAACLVVKLMLVGLHNCGAESNWFPVLVSPNEWDHEVRDNVERWRDEGAVFLSALIAAGNVAGIGKADV